MKFYYFNVLPDSGCYPLIEDFYIDMHKSHLAVVLFFVQCLSDFGINVVQTL